jgi:hypothetical protein
MKTPDESWRRGNIEKPRKARQKTVTTRPTMLRLVPAGARTALQILEKPLRGRQKRQ